MIFTAAGQPTEIRSGQTYTIITDKGQDYGITAEQAQAALVNAPRLGIVIERLIEEGPLMDLDAVTDAFRP